MGAVADLTASFARSCWCYYDIIKWRQDDGSVYFPAQGEFEANFGFFCCWLWWCMRFVLPVLVQELEFVHLGWVQLKLFSRKNSED
jgi:hypothetical protein